MRWKVRTDIPGWPLTFSSMLWHIVQCHGETHRHGTITESALWKGAHVGHLSRMDGENQSDQVPIKRHGLAFLWGQFGKGRRESLCRRSSSWRNWAEEHKIHSIGGPGCLSWFSLQPGEIRESLPPLAPVGWLCSLICLCHGLAKNHMKENILKRQANKEGTTSCEEAACKGLYFEAHLLCRNVLYYERGREKKLKRYNQNVNLFPLGSRLINNFIFFPVFLLYYITFLYLFHK